MPLIKTPDGQIVDLPDDATVAQRRALGVPVGTREAIEAGEREAIDAAYNDLNPYEKMIVGLRGSVRSGIMGVADTLGIADDAVAEFEARERPAIDAVARNPGFGTIGDMIPNVAAGAGGHIRSSIKEGLLEGAQAPEGERLGTGVVAGLQNLVFGKALEKAYETGSALVKTQVANRASRQAAGDAGQEITSAKDLVTNTDRASPVGALRERAAGIMDELTTTAGEGLEAVGQAERGRLAARADDLGLQVTPGQRYGNRQRQQLEVSFASNPITSGAFSDIAENNATRYAELATAAIGETGDAVTPAVLGRASDRLGATFNDVGAQLDEVLPEALAGDKIPRQFMNRLRTAAAREVGDIRNQTVGAQGGVNVIEENLRVRPMVDVIQQRIQDGTMTGRELMTIRSSLVDEVQQLRTTGGGAASGSQVFAMGDMVDAIDNLIVDSAAAGGQEGLASTYAVARSQWRVLQALEKSRALDNLGEVRSKTVDSALRREYPAEYRRGALTGDVAGREPSVQALADFFDATRIGSSVTQDIVGNSGTATRAFVGDLMNSDITPQSLTGLAARGTVGRMAGEAAAGAPGMVAGDVLPEQAMVGARSVLAAGQDQQTMGQAVDNFEDVLGQIMGAIGLGDEQR